MKNLSEFRTTLSLKEMASIVGGDSSWTCMEDTNGGRCGDVRTIVANDKGEVLSDDTKDNKCEEPKLAYSTVIAPTTLSFNVSQRTIPISASFVNTFVGV